MVEVRRQGNLLVERLQHPQEAAAQELVGHETPALDRQLASLL